jgi:hypothetical protein
MLETLEDRSLPSTLTVTNLSDSDPGSLRDIVNQASSGDTINFDSGLQGTITLTSGELAISKSLDIEGPGAAQITVSGNKASRVFDIAPGVAATLAGLTIANGQVKAFSSDSNVYVFGGGIYNAGTLTLSSCTVSGNQAESDITNSNGYLVFAYSYGGGLFNSGTASVTDCSFTGNIATFSVLTTGSNSLALYGGHGGAIANVGQLTVTDSTLDSNTGSGYGGGLYNSGQAEATGSTFSGNLAGNGGGATNTPVNTEAYGGGIANQLGTLTLANCTVANNQVQSGLSLAGASGRTISSGGGVYSLGEVSLTNCTVASNSVLAVAQGSSFAVAEGGGISIDPSSAHGGSIVNTIVAGNSSTMLGPDVFGPFASLGYNLIGATDDSSGWGGADLTGTKASPLNALLGVLQDNGGPTQTMALVPGSPAIDAGDNDYAPGANDQRGSGFDRIVNGTIDIGAFEVQGGGGAALPPGRGPAIGKIGQPLLATGWLGSMSSLNYSPADELLAQQSGWQSGPSDALQDLLARLGSGAQQAQNQDSILDALFTAEVLPQ